MFTNLISAALFTCMQACRYSQLDVLGQLMSEKARRNW